MQALGQPGILHLGRGCLLLQVRSLSHMGSLRLLLCMHILCCNFVLAEGRKHLLLFTDGISPAHPCRHPPRSGSQQGTGEPATGTLQAAAAAGGKVTNDMTRKENRGEWYTWRYPIAESDLIDAADYTKSCSIHIPHRPRATQSHPERKQVLFPAALAHANVWAGGSGGR